MEWEEKRRPTTEIWGVPVFKDQLEEDELGKETEKEKNKRKI